MKRLVGFLIGFSITSISLVLSLMQTSVSDPQLIAFAFVTLFGSLCGAYIADGL